MPRTLSNEDIAEFRERLCEAAARLFVEHGPDAVTMRRLAAELGCSPMTPYRYFKDKDEILAAVRASGFTAFAAALENAYAQPGDAAAKAVAVGQAYDDFALGNRNVYRLMFEMPEKNPEAYPELYDAAGRAQATMTQYIRGLVDAGVFVGDVDRIGLMFWAAKHGAVMLAMAGILSDRAAFDRLCQDTFEAFARGLRPETSR